MIDFTKPYCVKNGNAIQIESIAFLVERSSLANGIYVGERLADQPEKDVFNISYQANVRSLNMTVEEFLDRVIEKRDIGKFSLTGLPKFTKTFANALGDEVPLFVFTGAEVCISFICKAVFSPLRAFGVTKNSK